MMNRREQLELENYLREFQPRAPRALPVIGRSLLWHRLAAAVVLFASGSFSLWAVWHRSTVVPAIRPENGAALTHESTVSLTRLALEDPSEFASRMDRRSAETLEHFERADSALRVLAQD